MNKEKAVVLLSGGLDSSVTLAIASEIYDCKALLFNYGQRHSVELQCAIWQAQKRNIKHQIRYIDMGEVRKSALTNSEIDVPISRTPEQMEESIPVTYVPARNTIFLAHATQVAEEIDASAIFMGVNAVDYSGYPDCRPEYINAYQEMLNLATKNTVEGKKITIYTPLILMTKVQIVREGVKRGVDFSSTCSCYKAKIVKIDATTGPEIKECGECDSCILRNQALIQVASEAVRGMNDA